jgi:hypothetical protein
MFNVIYLFVTLLTLPHITDLYAKRKEKRMQ